MPRFTLLATFISLLVLWAGGNHGNNTANSSLTNKFLSRDSSSSSHQTRSSPLLRESGNIPSIQGAVQQDPGGPKVSAQKARSPVRGLVVRDGVQKERCGSAIKPCSCRGSSVDCSWTYLKFIPAFQRHVVQLDFSRNALSVINGSNFFENVTGVTYLDLSRNAIRYVHLHAFLTLRKLKILKFSENGLQYRSRIPEESLQPVLQIPTLEVLYLEGGIFGHLGPIPEDLFYDCQMHNLTTLHLGGNELRTLNLRVFKPLKNLKELHINTAEIRDIMYYDVLPSLVTLVAYGNLLTRSPLLCGHPSLKFFFPSLLYLNLAHNRIGWVSANIDCAKRPGIINMTLEGNRLVIINDALFSNEEYSQLRFLNLKDALDKHCTIESEAFANPSLEMIDLRFNRVDFASTVPSDAFARCSNLSELRLEGNLFRDITEEKFELLVADFRSLKVLTLADTQLNKVSRRMVKPLKNIQELDVSRNMLRAVPDGTFDHLELLSVLRLDSNLISTVSEKTFSAAMRSRLNLKSLNLSNNPFECTCSLLWFRHWLQTSPALFDYPHSPYKCSNMAGADVATFVLNEQQCLLSHEAYVWTVVCFTMYMVTLTLVTVVYRYRWHIRLLLYEAYRGERLAKWHYRRAEDFQYDLFVSYDSKDIEWVLGQLVSVLEQQMGLRLCVHQRDFIPGKNIVDNILDYLQVSKRVLAVFSPNFARSQWCHFELNLCLSHVLENDDVMVVVMLREVPTRDVTGAMAAVMKTTTYIEWANEPEAVDSFWRRMTLALRDVLPGSKG